MNKQTLHDDSHIESLLRQGAPTQLCQPTHSMRARVMSRIESSQSATRPRHLLRYSLAIAASLTLATAAAIIFSVPTTNPAPTPNTTTFSLMSFIDTTRQSIPQPSQLRAAASQAMLQPYAAESTALINHADQYAKALSKTLQPLARALSAHKPHSAPGL